MSKGCQVVVKDIEQRCLRTYVENSEQRYLNSEQQCLENAEDGELESWRMSMTMSKGAWATLKTGSSVTESKLMGQTIVTNSEEQL